MPVADKAKTMTLSLRLLRPNYDSTNALREDHGLDQVDSEAGALFIGQSNAHPPAWLSFINYFAIDPQSLFSQSCASILFLDIVCTPGATPRIFAICFGTGHHMINPDSVERNFGLKVVLNSIKRGNLRTLDTAALGATTMQKRVQASRDSDLRDFEVDVNRDLLRLASGTSDDKDFARALSGKDALTIRARLSPVDLRSKCLEALGRFEADHYKQDFGFIDHVTPVSEASIIAKLDDYAFAGLKDLVNGAASDLHLAIPEILSPEAVFEIGYFGLGLKPGAKKAFSEIAIDDYVAELRAGNFSAIRDMTAMKASHDIRIMKDGEGDSKQKRRLYSCLVFETEHEEQTYVLFDGQWFMVDQDFYQIVQDSYERLLTAPFVKSTKAVNEREFIQQLDANMDLLNIDQTKVSPKGAKGANLEPCDFLSRQKQFIHLKDGHGSAPLSHLWNQGLVASESFIRDAAFRKRFRDEAKKRQKNTGKTGFEMVLPDGRAKPQAADYTIIFGVMRHPYAKDDSVGLPFFSKVSLRVVAERLEMMNFGVELHLIRKERT